MKHDLAEDETEPQSDTDFDSSIESDGSALVENSGEYVLSDRVANGEAVSERLEIGVIDFAEAALNDNESLQDEVNVRTESNDDVCVEVVSALGAA